MIRQAHPRSHDRAVAALAIAMLAVLFLVCLFGQIQRVPG